MSRRCRTCGRSGSRRQTRGRHARPSMLWGRLLITLMVILLIYAWGQGKL